MIALGLTGQAQTFGQTSVWRPADSFRSQVLSACTSPPEKFAACFGQQMKLAGASPEALAFAEVLHNDGYMQAYRPIGHVSIAGINYPFRANENDELMLVNGEPSPIDIDQIQQLPADEMKADAAYQPVLAKHPDASLWPGSRATPADLLAVLLPDGSQQFVADYRVQEGCHACAVIGQAFFSFNFDTQGKLTGKTFTGFSDQWPGISETFQRRIISLPAGVKYTLMLPANRSTGFTWSLAKSSSNVPRPSGGKYVVSSAPRPGAGGEELWDLQSPSDGKEILQFVYSRPFEKNPAAKKTLEIVVRVR